MGIRYVLRVDLGLALVHWHGNVTLEGWEEHLRRLFADPDLSATQKQITDLRFASLDASVGEEGFRRVIAFLGQHRDLLARRVMAVVATENFDLARKFEQMGSALGANIIVFNALEPACLWLGVARSDAEAELRNLGTTEHGQGS